jgi:threonylcarbamoyladenosine tRNA methylthiotransferase MtaB
LEPLEVPFVYEAMAKYPWLARHIHSPLQSGSDDILKKMGRPYGREQYKEIIQTMLQNIPDLALGTDVLVGFPGETEEDFAQTYSLIEELPFSYLHVFPYSPRPGTKAALMPGQIPERIKTQRVKALKSLDKTKRQGFLLTQINRPHRALTENSVDSLGRIRVLTDSYIRAVWTDPQKPRLGTFVKVRLKLPADDGSLPEAGFW